MSATGTIYDELADINSWVNFTPGEVQYARFSTNLIFTAMKITDLYYSLCIARANLHFLDNNDFGDYAKDEQSMLKLVRNGQPVDLPVVYRKEMDIELTKSLLLQFDRDFVEYMFYLIDVLMPKDFTTRTIPFNEMLTALINKY